MGKRAVTPGKLKRKKYFHYQLTLPLTHAKLLLNIITVIRDEWRWGTPEERIVNQLYDALSNLPGDDVYAKERPQRSHSTHRR